MSRATIPSATLYLALVLAAGQQTLAANDWSIPCIQGQCSWDIPADSGASGTMNIVRLCLCSRNSALCRDLADRATYTQWGPTNAISDITPAAGWKITSCDPVATKQDIELVCEGDNPNCGHLFQGEAQNTIVRLPDTYVYFSLFMDWVRCYSRLTGSGSVWPDAVRTRGPAPGPSVQFPVLRQR